MAINIRQKGQNAERDIAKLLNGVVARVRATHNLPAFETRDELFQRNQNQSAVGGADLSNPLYLDIEVKRQEQLSINTWWKQCLESADRSGGIPILVFKQSRQKWRCMMLVDVPLQPTGVSRYASFGPVRAEITIEAFESWFKAYYESWLKASGDIVQN